MITRLTRLAMLASLALPAAASADVYRCVGADGRTTYSDSPCPRSASATNVTGQLQACTTPECEAQREKARAAAQARLAEDKAAAQQMQEQRLKAEAADIERRIRLEALRQQSAFDSAQQEAVSGVYAPAYPYPAYSLDPGYGRPLYPGYGRVGRWDGPGCKDLDCRPVARPLPYPPRAEGARNDRPVSFIDPPGAKK
jgi:hypothetical protein